MNDQHDLPLAPVDIDPEAAAAQVEALADATDRGRWPLRLLELTDICEAVIHRHPGAAQRELAERLVMEIANYLGGRPVYLPRGDALKRALRDRRIWRDSGKVSPDDLATREGLCLQQVYKIVGEMRALEKRRRHLALF